MSYMDATLLIADGHSASRAAMERFFGGCGFRVETSSSALDCLAKIWLLAPEIVAIDVDLPGGGAAAVVGLLRKRQSDAEMPLVVIVGDASPETLSRWTGVPCCFCIRKPLERDDLLDGIGLAAALVDLRHEGMAGVPEHDREEITVDRVADLVARPEARRMQRIARPPRQRLPQFAN